MKRENLRRVKCRYWAEVKFEDDEGYFHEWNGGRAIIELEVGTIIQTPYWFVQFIS